MGLRAALSVLARLCAGDEGRALRMKIFGRRQPVIAVGTVLAAYLLAACTSNLSGPPDASTPVALPQPELPSKIRASEVVGRWGYAAFHKPQDRARTEANARGQCKQPYVIGEGANGGVMMYLADSS